jgi:hypothetical protein
VKDFFRDISGAAAYQGRGPALLEKFEDRLRMETTLIKDLGMTKVEEEAATADLLDTVSRIAQTLSHPSLMALEANLRIKLFGLQQALKKYIIDADPSEVDADMWPTCVASLSWMLIQAASNDPITTLRSIDSRSLYSIAVSHGAFCIAGRIDSTKSRNSSATLPTRKHKRRLTRTSS